MATYKELVYMTLDEVKGKSDDFDFTEDHIIFMLNKYRSLLIKLRYELIKKETPKSLYQTLCLDLIKVPAIDGLPCEGGYYLRSKEKIPFVMTIGNPMVYPLDYYLSAMISFIPRERMVFVGHNKYLKNIIYCSIGPDNYLYFTSPNPQFLYLEKVKFTAVFEDPLTAELLGCPGEGVPCEIMDRQYPIEDILIPLLMLVVLQELLGAAYRPNDENNSARDELPWIGGRTQNNTLQTLTS